MDTNDQYFDCLCRTCMNELVEATSYDGNTKPQQQWQSIFDRIEECGAFRIAELLTNAVPQIEVHSRDELPKRICCKCLQELLIVYRFQQMCLQSQEQMRQKVSKKRSDLEISIIGAAMKGEIETNTAGSHALKTLQPSSTQQNLEHSSIQESLLETTEQLVKLEAAKTSGDDIDKLLEGCRDAEGNFSEFVKNEPIEDDEPSMEYSDGDTHSIISVKDEGLSVEIVEQQINEPNEDDEPRIECRGGETTSAISEKDERLPIEFEAQQINETNVKANRIIHERIHCDEKAHKCDSCEKSFTNNSLLRIHIRKHTGEKPYKCKYCERSFSQSWNRLTHMRLHLGDNVYRCELCTLAFPAASELRAHFTTHENEDPETRERNMKALKEAEAELEIKAKENVEKPKVPHCPQRFSNYANILQHKAIHKGAKINCEICGKSFRNYRLKEHKRIHSGEKPHKCHLCEKSFTQKANLREHIRSHTGEKPYKCKYCERSFSTGGSRIKHMRLHLGDNVHRCELCPLAFPAASKLRAHFTMHKNEDSEIRERNMKALKEAEAELEIKAKENNQEACDICGKVVRKCILKQHKLTHGGEKRYKCHLCEKSFSRRLKLRVHISQHIGENPHKCKYCERSFSNNSHRIRHMRVHFGDNVHRCVLCPLAFPVASALREHFITHENEDPETRERNMKALEEAEAEFQLRFSKEYTENTKSHSNIDGGHECPYCPRRFKTIANLAYHKESHEIFKREACNICGKVVRKCNLKQHKLTHGGGKPYKCHLCEKSFSKNFNLRIHIRHHTGERPYKCKYCERSYSQNIERMKHMRLHLGKNVYRCELCPLAFPVASELRAHFTTHRNEDPETRERNMKALKEAKAKLQLKFCKMKKKELRSRQRSESYNLR